MYTREAFYLKYVLSTFSRNHGNCMTPINSTGNSSSVVKPNCASLSRLLGISSRLVHVPFYCNNRFIKTDWCISYTYVIHTVLPLASYHINVSLQSYGTLINWNAGSCCLDMLAGLLLKWVLGISIGNLCISLECMVVVFSGST